MDLHEPAKKPRKQHHPLLYCGRKPLGKLLNMLLSAEAEPGDKCRVLEEDFHIKMTRKLESEVSLMCNLSKGVEERGIQKGITAMVSTLKELKVEDDIIVSKIREKFDLTEETAKTYLK